MKNMFDSENNKIEKKRKKRKKLNKLKNAQKFFALKIV